MDFEETWNFITGCHFIIDHIKNQLDVNISKLIMASDFIRILKISHQSLNNLDNLIDLYNDYMKEKYKGEYLVTNSALVVKNLNKLFRLDSVSDYEQNFKKLLYDTFSHDIKMAEHLLYKWEKVYDKNITLWLGGLDPNNKLLVLKTF